MGFTATAYIVLAHYNSLYTSPQKDKSWNSLSDKKKLKEKPKLIEALLNVIKGAVSRQSSGLQYFAKRNETKRNGTLRNGTLRNGT